MASGMKPGSFKNELWHSDEMANTATTREQRDLARGYLTANGAADLMEMLGLDEEETEG